MDKDFLRILEEARDVASVPFVINSGFRCDRYNREIGSTSKNHTSGKAADIHVASDRSRRMMLEAFTRCHFPGIGIGKQFIHVDTNHEVDTCWVY